VPGVCAFQTIDPPARRANRANLLALIGFVGLSALVWLSNGAVTASGVGGWYHVLSRPAFTPPDWVFGPVWSVLYVTIGVSAWLVWRRVDIGLHRKRAALRIWGWQLLVNAVWPPVFFGLHWMGVGLAILLLLVGSVALTIHAFWPIRRAAGLLLLPYLAWVCYATYLDAQFWRLAAG